MSLGLSVRRRYWISRLLAVSSGVDSEGSLDASTVLPADWQQQRWALAEIRGYRGNTTALTNPAIITSLKALRGADNYLPLGNGDGFGMDPQAGLFPVFLPMPDQWSGGIVFLARSDSGATMSFRFHFSFVRLSEREWNELRGCA